MPIPLHLRAFAGLETEVLVHGAIDRVELWNPAAWAERVLPEESWLLEDDEDEHDDDADERQGNDRKERQHRNARRTDNDRRLARRTHWTMCSSSTGALEGHSTLFHAGRPDLHLPLDPPAEGLQMAHSFEHIPCCATKWCRCSPPCPPASSSTPPSAAADTLRRCSRRYPELRVVGLDRDPAALEAARAATCPRSATGSR